MVATDLVRYEVALKQGEMVLARTTLHASTSANMTIP